jgi:hypothetical protein
MPFERFSIPCRRPALNYYIMTKEAEGFWVLRADTVNKPGNPASFGRRIVTDQHHCSESTVTWLLDSCRQGSDDLSGQNRSAAAVSLR